MGFPENSGEEQSTFLESVLFPLCCVDWDHEGIEVGLSLDFD